MYGIAYVACYFSLPEILHRYETLSHAVLCNSKKATSSYVDCLPAMAQSFRKPSRATCLVHNALIGILIQEDTTHPEKYVQSVRMYRGPPRELMALVGKWQYLITPCWVMCKTSDLNLVIFFSNPSVRSRTGKSTLPSSFPGISVYIGITIF